MRRGEEKPGTRNPLGSGGGTADGHGRGRRLGQYDARLRPETDRCGTGTGADAVTVRVSAMRTIGIGRRLALGRIRMLGVAAVVMLSGLSLGDQPRCIDRARIDEGNDGSRHRW